MVTQKLFHVYSFALVEVGKLLAQTEKSKLTSDNIIMPGFFNEEIGMLLSQYSDHYGLRLDVKQISKDIFVRINKGLVGACFKAIETEAMVGENELLHDRWIKYSSVRLIKFIKERCTYKSII